MPKDTPNPAEVLRKIKALERASMAGARTETAVALSPDEAGQPVSNEAVERSSRPMMFQPSFGSLGQSDDSPGEGVQEAVASMPEATETVPHRRLKRKSTSFGKVTAAMNCASTSKASTRPRWRRSSVLMTG